MPRSATVMPEGGGTVALDAAAFEAELQHAPRPRGGQSRARCPPARHRVDQDPRPGVRRRCQAVAAEGHRPGPRGIVSVAGLDRRRHRVRSDPSRLHVQGQPQGPASRAAQRAVGSRRARVARRVRRSGVRRTVDQAGGRSCSPAGSAEDPTLVVLDEREAAAGKSFRNLTAGVRDAGRGRRGRRRDRRRVAAGIRKRRCPRSWLGPTADPPEREDES